MEYLAQFTGDLPTQMEVQAGWIQDTMHAALSLDFDFDLLQPLQN